MVFSVLNVAVNDIHKFSIKHNMKLNPKKCEEMLKNLDESPLLNFLEQTGKDKGLPVFTCHTSIKTVNVRTDWMDKKSKHHTDEHF